MASTSINISRFMFDYSCLLVMGRATLEIDQWSQAGIAQLLQFET
jgi:hypothetical protein